MHPPGTPKNEDAALEQLWRQVRASRGTPAPDAAHLAGFMAGLGALERDKLQSVLLLEPNDPGWQSQSGNPGAKKVVKG